MTPSTTAPATTPADQLAHGTHGLVYLTDPDDAAMFIAAATETAARATAARARLALRDRVGDIPGHQLHRRPDGGYITVPDPIWMTPAQRTETIARLHRHLAEHVPQPPQGSIP